jgi:RNA polymerase sigma-70 factor (ECF subfamily)
VDEPEPAVIRAAIAGDHAAFEQLVRAYQQLVWRYLRRLLGDDTLAEDVAQETFLRLYRRLPTYGFQAKFSSWVIQVARNAGIDELRRRGRAERLVAAMPPRPTVTGAADVRAELDAALATLPTGLREALLLIEVLGLRYREAAVVLGVPTGTVKSRVYAARVRLHRWAADGDVAGEGATP